MTGFKRFQLLKTKIGKKLIFQCIIASTVVFLYLYGEGQLILYVEGTGSEAMFKAALLSSTILLLPFAFVTGLLYVTVTKLCHLIEKYDEILMKKGLLDKSLLD